ncbi:MAG: hypothetical protein HY842_11670 [Bacteroidetes bacterium]|nr:hypothetical protein [Bacteroidota bacterium]
MDYAFVPGSTTAEDIIKDMFQQRPNTSLISSGAIRNIDQYFSHLDTAVGVTRPVGDIFIACHANNEGWMQIQLARIFLDTDGNPATPRVEQFEITYEVLIEALNLPRKGRIPTDVRDANTRFLVKGCRLGHDNNVQFIQKLKDVLGGIVPVIVPKHFDEFWYRTDVGLIEYMSYDFSLANPTAYASRAALITAFQGANKTFLDGMAVPNAKWGAWLPRTVSAGRRSISYSVNINPSLQPLSGSPITSIRLTIDEGFRHDLDTIPYAHQFAAGVNPPASNADRRQFLLAQMDTDPQFDPAQTDNWPFYKNYEFASLATFKTGFNWATPTYNATTRLLQMVGTRHKYTLIVPITDSPDTANNLFFNYYPYSANVTPRITQLLETDNRFFRTV